MNYSEDELSGSTNDLVETAMPLLGRLGRLLYAAFARHAAVSGLSLGQMKALALLHQAGQATVGEIAAGMGVSMPAASELIDQLVARELVERGANPADRRQVVLRMTPEALRIGNELKELRRAQVRAALAALGPAERAAFVPVLESLAGALEQDPCALPGPQRHGANETTGLTGGLASGTAKSPI